QAGPRVEAALAPTIGGKTVVRGALGLGDHELAADEFDLLPRLEYAQIDEALVLGAAETARPDFVGQAPLLQHGLRAVLGQEQGAFLRRADPHPLELPDPLPECRRRLDRN